MPKKLFEKGNKLGKKFVKGEAQSEIGRKGAIASNKVQKEKRTAKEKLKYILSLNVNSKEQKMIEETFTDFEGIADNTDLLVCSLLQKAKRGDTKAVELILKMTDELNESIKVDFTPQKVFITQEEQQQVLEHIENVINDAD